MKRLYENKLLYAIILLVILYGFGIVADINLYKYKFLGEANSNYEYVNEEKDNIQTEFSVNFPLKIQMIDFNGFMRCIMGQREMNGIVKLDNGYLTAVDGVMTDEFVNANAQAIIQYNEYCKARGITVLYVQPAYKISKFDNQLPTGVEDGHNETIDKLLTAISYAGVETLDLRQTMYNEGINQYDLYYKTDHHWTTEGGFYAYTKVVQLVAEKTGTGFDEKLVDINNYEIVNYPKWHLGMRGQRTGVVFAGIDDYHLIYPKFDTHILNQTDGSIKTLADAMIKWDVFENRDVQNRYTYDSAYTNSEINVLQSQDAETDLNVVLLSDSFQHAINPYMLLTYKNFHVGSYGILSTASLEEWQPDVVVIMMWPGRFSTNSVNFQFVDDAVK